MNLTTSISPGQSDASTSQNSLSRKGYCLYMSIHKTFAGKVGKDGATYTFGGAIDPLKFRKIPDS